MALLSLFGCKQYPPLETVQQVDLKKYAGKWYEIAAFPQRFQKGCECTTATYELTDKGYVKVINRCKKPGGWDKADGKAFVQKGTRNTKLKVQFFWPFRGKYWVIGLADDYSWAVVGHPNREYLWILARKPQMPEETYQDILKMVTNKGFDTDKLVETTHNCKEDY